LAKNINKQFAVRSQATDHTIMAFAQSRFRAQRFTINTASH
jgi:hypothetical protein